MDADRYKLNHNDASVSLREELGADQLVDSIIAELLSSSDDDEEEERKWGASLKGRSANKARDFVAACAKAVNDCLKRTSVRL
jgi:hypothetical protein